MYLHCKQAKSLKTKINRYYAYVSRETYLQRENNVSRETKE